MTRSELAADVSLEISIWADIRIRVQESSTPFRSIHLIFPFYYYISTMQPTGLGTFVLTSASTLSTLRGPQLITPTGDFSNLTWTPPTPPTSHRPPQPIPFRKPITPRPEVPEVTAAPLVIKSLLLEASGKAK